MSNHDFTTTVSVSQSPARVFEAINNPRGWWSEEINGTTDRLNEEFDYHYRDVHSCKIRVIELVPEKRIAWLVLENFFNFTNDKSEWIGNKIVFEIIPKGGHTEIRVTQHGLVPEYECFEICSNAWTGYVQNSLRNLVETGKGNPNPIETDPVSIP
jgi:uncharacterized protein YndB with AHSA1/START domain